MKLFGFTLMTAIAVLTITLVCCTKNNESNIDLNEDLPPMEPLVTQIYIQPLNTYSATDAEAIGMKLADVTDEICQPVWAQILPTVQLGDEFKNEAGTRYRADKILEWLKKGPLPVIALINDDISCTYKGVDDWGVLGLSFRDKDVCVVSTYRVKNKWNFWKVVYHEFGHAYFGLPHCPADDPKCIMQDAKGHPNFGPKNEICDSCWSSYFAKKMTDINTLSE